MLREAGRRKLCHDGAAGSDNLDTGPHPLPDRRLLSRAGVVKPRTSSGQWLVGACCFSRHCDIGGRQGTGANGELHQDTAAPTISGETGSRLHLVERGENNVRVSPASCVEWSDARELVVMVCGRRPRRVLKLRSRNTDASNTLSIHHYSTLLVIMKRCASAAISGTREIQLVW